MKSINYASGAGGDAPRAEEQTELAALRAALRMMGLDPTKVAAFVAEPTDFACKAILFDCVGLDEAKLVARVGDAASFEGWRAYWDQLQCADAPCRDC